MGKDSRLFKYIARSGFVRSVFLRVLSIFILVSIAIATIAFYSFTSEVRKNVLAERQSKLAAVEETISKRMDEITAIAYSVGTDPEFFLEPVADDGYSGYEMSSTLERYLAGNSFIEHLAYYRLAEPDTIYISSGQRSLTEFFCTSFGLDKATAEENIKGIQNSTHTQVMAITYGEEKNSYFAYLYPLPQLSTKPQAFVLMLIPVKEVKPLFETLLTNSSGMVAVFDSSGDEIYRKNLLGEDIPLEDYVASGADDEDYVSESRTRYVLQKVKSASNGWTYVSVIRHSDTLSGIANRQLMFIVLLLLLVFVALIAMFICIIVQYKPISNLVATVVDDPLDGGNKDVIDERVLLTNTIATLKDDSQQKQRFETAYYEAEAASKAKSAFLSNMSHDIRTPMNAIIGMTAIALRHADEPEYVRDCLQNAQVSSQYLLDIINNVLDMSRIESGRFVLSEEVINLPELIDGLVALIQASVESKSQRLTVDIGDIHDRTVVCDNVRLTQVFVNILTNAVKFTPDGGTISVSMRQIDSASDAMGTYVFAFSDTGIGMPPEFVGQVFDTFSRAKGSNVSKVEGTGLGMAIAKNLVELMGGAIQCESELGSGTTFTVTMPMKLADEESSAAASDGFEKSLALGADAAGKVIDLTGKRILLAEDNDINCEIACRILGETHAEVVAALDGKDALDVFAQHPVGYFDIILMDIQMPVMNGYEATAAIRALDRPDAQTIPIYAMTANTFDEDARQVRDSGMNGHIGKPYTPAVLYKILGQALHVK